MKIAKKKPVSSLNLQAFLIRVYFTYSPGITMVISDSAKLAQG